MAKAKKVEAVETAEARYVIGARGAKYSGHEGTKYGTNGTASTWNLVCDTVKKQGGSITRSELAAIVRSNGDKGYAAYAIRNRWLVPSA